MEIIFDVVLARNAYLDKLRGVLPNTQDLRLIFDMFASKGDTMREAQRGWQIRKYHLPSPVSLIIRNSSHSVHNKTEIQWAHVPQPGAISFPTFHRSLRSAEDALKCDSPAGLRCSTLGLSRAFVGLRFSSRDTRRAISCKPYESWIKRGTSKMDNCAN